MILALSSFTIAVAAYLRHHILPIALLLVAGVTGYCAMGLWLHHFAIKTESRDLKRDSVPSWSALKRRRFTDSTKQPSSSSIESCSESSEDEADSILLAISTLFQQEGSTESDQQDRMCRSNHQTNKIVARILPRDLVHYKERKPSDRLCDPVHLRQLLLMEDDLNVEENAMIQNKISDDLVVTLEVDATIPSACDPKIRYRLQMNMQYV